MQRYPKNFVEVLVEMSNDKRISPIFWIITVIYFLTFAYIYFFFNEGTGPGRGAIGIFIIPYFIFSTIYIAYISGKKK